MLDASKEDCRVHSPRDNFARRYIAPRQLRLLNTNTAENGESIAFKFPPNRPRGTANNRSIARRMLQTRVEIVLQQDGVDTR